MTPNPTARPFIVGALLFLTLIGAWPGRARADRDLGSRRAPASAVSSQR
jgi:hypothetical protein